MDKSPIKESVKQKTHARQRKKRRKKSGQVVQNKERERVKNHKRKITENRERERTKKNVVEAFRTPQKKTRTRAEDQEKQREGRA